jgi:transcription elongation factor Elf1
MNLDVCPDCGGDVVMVEGTLEDFHSQCESCGQEYATPDMRRWRKVDTVRLAAWVLVAAVWYTAGVLVGGQF